MGDFNISSRKFNHMMDEKFLRLAEVDPAYSIFVQEDFDPVYEYEIMLKILSNEGGFEVIDYKDKLSDDKGGPTTFAAIETDEEGYK